MLPFESCSSVPTFPGEPSVFPVVPASLPTCSGVFLERLWVRGCWENRTSKVLNSPPTPGSPYIKKSAQSPLGSSQYEAKVSKHFPGVLAPEGRSLFPFAQFPTGSSLNFCLPTLTSTPRAAPNRAVTERGDMLQPPTPLPTYPECLPLLTVSSPGDRIQVLCAPRFPCELLALRAVGSRDTYHTPPPALGPSPISVRWGW